MFQPCLDRISAVPHVTAYPIADWRVLNTSCCGTNSDHSSLAWGATFVLWTGTSLGHYTDSPDRIRSHSRKRAARGAHRGADHRFTGGQHQTEEPRFHSAGETDSLRIVADKNVLLILTADVVDGTLRLGHTPGATVVFDNPVRHESHADQPDRAGLSGAGRITRQGLQMDSLDVEVKGRRCGAP